MTTAYSNEQMLAAVVNAAMAWTERLDAADREQAKTSETTKTAILVLDFEELAAIRDALERSIATRIVAVLRDAASPPRVQFVLQGSGLLEAWRFASSVRPAARP